MDDRAAAGRRPQSPLAAGTVTPEEQSLVDRCVERRRATLVRRGAADPRGRNPHALRDGIHAVRRDVAEGLRVAGRPFDAQGHGRGAGQAEVRAPVVLRPAVVGAVLDAQLAHAVRGRVDPRTGRIAFGLTAHQVDLDPAPTVADVAEQHVGATGAERTQVEAVVHEQVEETVHVVIGCGNRVRGPRAACHGDAHGPDGTAGAGHSAERPVTEVFPELVLDVARARATAEVQVDIHVVVEIAGGHADALNRHGKVGAYGLVDEAARAVHQQRRPGGLVAGPQSRSREPRNRRSRVDDQVGLAEDGRARLRQLRPDHQRPALGGRIETDVHDRDVAQLRRRRRHAPDVRLRRVEREGRGRRVEARGADADAAKIGGRAFVLLVPVRLERDLAGTREAEPLDPVHQLRLDVRGARLAHARGAQLRAAEHEQVHAPVVVEVGDGRVDALPDHREVRRGVCTVVDLLPRQRGHVVDLLRPEALVRTDEVQPAVVVEVQQLAIVEPNTEQLRLGSRLHEMARRPLPVQLGNAAELRHDEVLETVAVVVEPDRQASAEVDRRQPALLRTIDQPLVLVHEQLAQVAGAGADQQVLVAVAVEVRPGAAVRVGFGLVAPDEDLRSGLEERAVAAVEPQAWPLPMVAGEDIWIAVAVQVPPRGAVAFAHEVDPRRARDVGEGDLCHGRASRERKQGDREEPRRSTSRH